MARTCIFCNGPLTGNRSEEHCIPRWLIEYLGMKDEDIQLGVARTTDDVILESRDQPLGNFIEGRVCGSCNKGWRKRMEDDTSPTLKSLIDGKIPIYNLSSDEKLKVAKWATKTAFVVSHASPVQKLPDNGHLRHMYETRGDIPPRVGAFAQIASTGPGFLLLQHNNWMHITHSEVPTRPPAGSYKTAMKFRQLILLVAYWPHEPTGFVLAAGVHIPLIAGPMNASYVPNGPLNIEDTNVVLRFFSNSLAIADMSQIDARQDHA